MICDIYEELNGKMYNEHDGHLYFSAGDLTDENHLKRFKMIHKLFDFGQFRYKKKSGNGKKYCDANKVWHVTSMAKVQKLYNEKILRIPPTPKTTKKKDPKTKDMQTKKGGKKDPNRKSPPSSKTSTKEPSDGTKTPSSSKDSISTNTPISLNAQCKQRNSVATTFIQNDDELSLEKIYLRDVEQKHNILDVNQSQLYLLDGSTNKDKLEAEVGLHLREMVELLVQFFVDCYVDADATQEVKDDFAEDVKKCMSRFEMFSMMDYVVDKDTNLKQYTIISALVFEQALYLEMMKHSMIHLFGARPGYEEKGYMEDLLFRVANKTHLKSKNLIFITKYGKFHYQICESEDFDRDDDDSDENNGIVTP